MRSPHTLRALLLGALAGSALVLGSQAQGQEKTDPAAFERSVSKAIAYLAKAQADDGSYSSFAGGGPTALITTALIRHGRTLEDPQVAAGLKYLADQKQPDGGIYQKDSRYRNYETCLAVMCLAEANKDGRYDDLLSRADKYLKGIQFDGEEGHDSDSVAFGGSGYGGNERPDLSNTAFLVDALRSCGNAADSQAIQNALVFVSRCQNFESEFNTTPNAGKVNDGGFYYTAAAGGASPAGQEGAEGLRSYGTMTYAGLKSLLFAGLTEDDPRVKAAVGWIAKNYRLDQNPGMGNAGLYYYYHTFAKCLDTLGQDTIADADGKEHHWRAELANHLIGEQQEDGSWVNSNTKWLEGDPNLATGFALLSLSHCKPKAE